VVLRWWQDGTPYLLLSALLAARLWLAICYEPGTLTLLEEWSKRRFSEARTGLQQSTRETGIRVTLLPSP